MSGIVVLIQPYLGPPEYSKTAGDVLCEAQHDINCLRLAVHVLSNYCLTECSKTAVRGSPDANTSTMYLSQ